MQAYAEGFEVLKASEFDLDLREIAGIWRYGSVVRSWLLELLHAAFETEGGELERIKGYVEDSGEGRWTVAEAIAEDVPVPVITRGAVRPLRLAAGRVVRGEGERGAAQRVRRPRGAGDRDGEGVRPGSARVTAVENPLIEGLQLRRRPEPCIFVIFGASGDLAQRKLMPALYALAFRRLLPEHFAVVGTARSEETDESFRERMKEAVQRNARDEFRQDVWDDLAAGMRYCPLEVGDADGEDRLATLLEEIDQERGTHGNRVYYLAVPPSAIGTIVSAIAERRRPERLGAADRREAVRPRPRLGQGAQPADLGALRRERGLPHRPLPRQGDGAEHAGAAVRERHLRADLEPAVHRPRPDHRRRVDRHRGPRRVLRAGGRDPRHVPEPPAAAASRSRRWSRRSTSPPSRCATRR